MQTKLPRYERSRRSQIIWFTVVGAITSAAIAAGMIYFIYMSSHLRK